MEKDTKCGNLATCKNKSIEDGETMVDHFMKYHPELLKDANTLLEKINSKL